MSKSIFGLVSIVTALSIAGPVLADEISATHSTSVETPAGTAKATRSSKTSTDGMGAKVENSVKTEQSNALGGYRADSVKQTQSSDGLGTTESSTSAKTTVSP